MKLNELRINLNKRTKADLLALCKSMGLFTNRTAQRYLYEVLLKKWGKFHTCTKAELIRIIFESGIDLSDVLSVGGSGLDCTA